MPSAHVYGRAMKTATATALMAAKASRQAGRQRRQPSIDRSIARRPGERRRVEAQQQHGEREVTQLKERRGHERQCGAAEEAEGAQRAVPRPA